jgi:hypothetical protein
MVVQEAYPLIPGDPEIRYEPYRERISRKINRSDFQQEK